MPVLPVPVIAKYFCSAIARPDIARPDIARAHELTHIEQYLPERESETDFLFVSPSQLSLSSSLLKKKMKMKNEKWQLRFAVPLRSKYGSQGKVGSTRHLFRRRRRRRTFQ